MLRFIDLPLCLRKAIPFGVWAGLASALLALGSGQVAWAQASKVTTAAAATASGAATHASMQHGSKPPACAEPTLACAVSATPHVDAKDRVWLAWSAAGAVSVARSDDGGAHFGPAVLIGQHGTALDTGSDARVQLLVDGQGRVIVAYGMYKDKQYNAQVMLSTSTDDGAHFSAPKALSPDGASQRFPTLTLMPDDSVFMSWLDKRHVAEAQKRGETVQGASVAYAWSKDGGVSVQREHLMSDQSCECCRLVTALSPKGQPVMMLREIFPDRERDHAVITVQADGEPGPIRRVAHDKWAIDGCPHHGPSLAVSPGGGIHATWFTQGQARQGLFYSHSHDDGAHFSEPIAMGQADRQPGRPQLLTQGKAVWLAWKEFDGQQITIKVRQSIDGGHHWLPDRTVGSTKAYADHPMLVSLKGHVHLSWLNREQGYALTDLEASP